jgi:hypothetical protein
VHRHRNFEKTRIGNLGKIPGMCNAVKVECINLMHLIDEEDWVLGQFPRGRKGAATKVVFINAANSGAFRVLPPQSHEIIGDARRG